MKLRRFLVAFFLGGLITMPISAEMSWEFFHKEDGISLFRAPKREDGLTPFKAEASVKGTVEDYLKTLMDHKLKPQWAPKLKEVIVHLQKEHRTFVFSEFYKTPWPATDRQFLLEGKVFFYGENRVELKAVNATEKSFKSEGHIVCDVRFLNLLLKKIDDGHTKIVFEFLGDMKGWMPVWLINIIQKKWPLRFIQGIRRHVEAGNVRETEAYRSLYKRLKSHKDYNESL